MAASRKPSAKKPKPKPKSKLEVPFPFLGQGDAEYYEWFEMWIWFEQPVPKAQRKAVLKDAPVLCKMDATWPNASLLWASTGDQWIQQHLIEEYGSKASNKKRSRASAKREADEDPDDEFLDDMIAGDGETSAFNADIERWLRALHARRPILFAARREDGEAGGTQLGPWHDASLKLFSERVIPKLEPLAKTKVKADDLRRTPISIALEYLGDKPVSRALRARGTEDD